MKVTYRSDHEVTSEAARAATGKTLEQWFQDLDAKGGPEQGRKALGEYLTKTCKLDAWWAVTILVEYDKSRGVTEKDGRPRGYNICVTKTIATDPARVYTALLASITEKAQEGGAFDDGDGHRGVFKRLNPGKLVRFTWEGTGHQPGETVEVKLTASGAKTGVVLNHERLPDRAAADGMRGAWAGVLDALREKLS